MHHNTTKKKLSDFFFKFDVDVGLFCKQQLHGQVKDSVLDEFTVFAKVNRQNAMMLL